jgi:hypothetical protein
MGDIKVTLDISDLTQYLEKFAKDVVKDVQKGIEGLAKSAHAKIKEDAQNGLHSFREKYLESLSPPEQVDKYLWVITLKSDAAWIEEGKPAWDMKGEPGKWGLLKKPTGIVKEGENKGKAYKIIPMNQAKSSTEMTVNKGAYEKSMVETVKAELRKRKIPYKKLEIDPNTGSPRIGKLHSLDIDSNIPGKGNTPQLHGLNIYQTKQKDGSVKRSITTFRTAIEGDGKWMHPTAEAKNFFLTAKTFAEQEWESKWLPQILEKYKGG